jgi:hypothetical protein
MVLIDVEANLRKPLLVLVRGDPFFGFINTLEMDWSPVVELEIAGSHEIQIHILIVVNDLGWNRMGDAGGNGIGDDTAGQ